MFPLIHNVSAALAGAAVAQAIATYLFGAEVSILILMLGAFGGYFSGIAGNEPHDRVNANLLEAFLVGGACLGGGAALIVLVGALLSGLSGDPIGSEGALFATMAAGFILAAPVGAFGALVGQVAGRLALAAGLAKAPPGR